MEELEFLQKESGQTVGNMNQLQSEKLSLEHKVGVMEKSLEQQSQVWIKKGNLRETQGETVCYLTKNVYYPTSWLQ